MTEALLRLEGVSKRYGATLALNGVHFDLRAGEVHALMGENGAGKSTLMKILAGNVERDAGKIIMDGQEIEIRSPRDAAAHGIAIIHQELNTVPEMTVAEVRAGIEAGWISGGMIPKVETCIYAIERGVKGAVIVDGRVPHAVLIELFTNGGAGTLIRP